jgi:hypothetical protein
MPSGSRPSTFSNKASFRIPKVDFSGMGSSSSPKKTNRSIGANENALLVMIREGF